MRKVTLSVLLAILALSLSGCGIPSQQPAEPSQTDDDTFNLTFNYGVGAKNQLNTFNNTFTKDMIVDAPITIPLALSDAERTSLEEQITVLGLFSEEEHGEVWTMTSPCDRYELTTEKDGVKNEVVWDGCTKGTNADFQTFTEYVRAMVESKEVYQALPEPQGGYL